MVRNWVITPYHYNDLEAFQKVWNYDRHHGVIAIGWSEIGDLEVWPESHWPGFALRKADVFKSYMA